MALRAQRSDVLRLVLFHASKLVGVGLLVGLAATFATSRVMGSDAFPDQRTTRLLPSLTTLLLAVVCARGLPCCRRRTARINPLKRSALGVAPDLSQ